MTELSVILCTHNPRENFLGRVLDGLRQQTLSYQRWELLIVDNASTPAICDLVKLDWHPAGHIVVESALGLTSARLAGIDQARGELLVFVDDDAILAPDYLEQALKIAKSFGWIGAFGGSIRLQFQSPPEEWTREYWPRLAERTVSVPLWSNFLGYPDTTPWGVGMCLRRRVAVRYSTLVKGDPVRLSLDRSGRSLMSGGDDDMARTSHQLGLGTGLFPDLELLHLIPSERLNEDYLVRLVEAQAYSGVIVNALHGEKSQTVTIGPIRRIAGKLKRRITMPVRKRRFIEASLRGREKAIHDIASMRVSANL